MISTDTIWAMYRKDEVRKFDELSGHWYDISKYISLARYLHENGFKTDKEGLHDYLICETNLNRVECAFVCEYMARLEATV